LTVSSCCAIRSSSAPRTCRAAEPPERHDVVRLRPGVVAAGLRTRRGSAGRTNSRSSICPAASAAGTTAGSFNRWRCGRRTRPSR
jgi:hypothetical protein